MMSFQATTSSEMGVRAPCLRYPNGPCLCEYFSVMHNHAYEVTNEGIFHNVNSPSMGSATGRVGESGVPVGGWKGGNTDNGPLHPEVRGRNEERSEERAVNWPAGVVNDWANFVKLQHFQPRKSFKKVEKVTMALGANNPQMLKIPQGRRPEAIPILVQVVLHICPSRPLPSHRRRRRRSDKRTSWRISTRRRDTFRIRP